MLVRKIVYSILRAEGVYFRYQPKLIKSISIQTITALSQCTHGKHFSRVRHFQHKCNMTFSTLNNLSTCFPLVSSNCWDLRLFLIENVIILNSFSSRTSVWERLLANMLSLGVTHEILLRFKWTFLKYLKHYRNILSW